MQRVCSRPGQQHLGALLCPWGPASSCMSIQAEPLPSGCVCLQAALRKTTTSCFSQLCHKLAGLEVPARQPEAAALGKDKQAATGQGRQHSLLPSAKVELTL